MPKLTASTLISGLLASDAAYRSPLVKADRLSPAFAPATGAAGAQSIVLAQAISVLLPSGVVHHFPTDTAVVLDDLLPAEWPGTDWAIHVDASGAISATRSFTPTEGGVIIGGFHYAMGSNAHIPENASTFYGDGPALKLGVTETQVDTGDFYYRLPGGEITYQASSNIDLELDSVNIPPADPIPAGKWGIYAFVIDALGNIMVYPGVDNATGYDTESFAINSLYDALPPMNDKRLIGHITVQAAAGTAFTPGTDALEGGTGGTPAQQTHYYSGSSMGPAINPYSCWDLNWRPTCPDPRGMACIAGKFWMDIYLTNNRPDLYGTSAANVTIADGSSRAARPLSIGGKSDGSLLMPSHNWWDSGLLAGAYGKSLPSLDELQEATLGATQGVATIWDRATTSYYGALTSMYGLCQSFGQIWIWATDAGDSSDRKAIMGGHWGYSGSAGSRYVFWGYTATNSFNVISSRFRADHLIA